MAHFQHVTFHLKSVVRSLNACGCWLMAYTPLMLTLSCSCCLMLHNITVMEHVAMDDGTVKNDMYYDIVRKAINPEKEVAEICVEAEAL
jgi:hypothetical protein